MNTVDIDGVGIVTLSTAKPLTKNPGLRKQVLVANTLSKVREQVFSINPELPFPGWFSALPALLGRMAASPGIPGVLCVQTRRGCDVSGFAEACSCYGIEAVLMDNS